MLHDSCWVLLRPDLTWHVLGQHERDPLGLFGRPTLCGQTSPTDNLGVIAFSHMQPRIAPTAGPDHSLLCTSCYAILIARHDDLKAVAA